MFSGQVCKQIFAQAQQLRPHVCTCCVLHTGYEPGLVRANEQLANDGESMPGGSFLNPPGMTQRHKPQCAQLHPLAARSLVDWWQHKSMAARVLCGFARARTTLSPRHLLCLVLFERKLHYTISS